MKTPDFKIDITFDGVITQIMNKYHISMETIEKLIGIPVAFQEQYDIVSRVPSYVETVFLYYLLNSPEFVLQRVDEARYKLSREELGNLLYFSHNFIRKNEEEFQHSNCTGAGQRKVAYATA